jgi:ABC-type transport system substrate-binding protein/DNA-binding SARP family transcriptional activator
VIEFRVLGPLEARGPAGPVTIGAGKQRLLLAMLVLSAGEIVTRDAIVDALWPEQPPPSAPHAVESYVSRLRTGLRTAGAADEVIASEPAGYRLVRDGNRLDWDEFDELAHRAKAAMTEGDHETADRLTGKALDLWRGPALAGIANERGVRGGAGRLEEQRVLMLELRGEAELALGRHAEAIPWLRAETARHPERERTLELLMLALYRAARQSEALDAYRRSRRYLHDHLGLEPGPSLRGLEARILRHDPTLDAPRPAAAIIASALAEAPDGSRRRRALRGAASAAMVLAIAAALLVVSGERGRAGAAKRALLGLRMPALGVLDPSDGRAIAAVALGADPSGIATGAGADWATSYDNGTLLRVSLSQSAVVQTVHVGQGASGLAVSGGDVWVAATLEDQITRVNADTNEVVQRIAVGTSPTAVAAGSRAVWVANTGDGTVSRIDPITGAVLGVTRVGAEPAGIATGDGAVWVALRGAGAVARLDPRTGNLVQTIAVGSGPSAVAVDGQGVWVANELDSTVSLIDPVSNSVVLTREVSGAPIALAATGRGVWVAANAAVMTRVAGSGQTRTLNLPSPALALAPSPSGLLVGVGGLGAGHRGGTLVVRIADPLEEAGPQGCCTDPPQVLMLSYDGLLSYSKSPASPDTLVPDLALAIPPAQDGGRSYTFRLRPGLRYWNGAPVRASDLRRGLELAAQSSGISAAYLAALPGALACPGQPRCDLSASVLTDDRAGTITLRLSHPDPDLLPALGLPEFAPAPPGSGITPGTGPYRITRFVPGRLAEFTRNPYFTDWAPTAQPPGYPDRILVYSGGTASGDITAVLDGRADYTFDTPAPEQLRMIDLRYPGLLHTDPLPDTETLILNTHEAPFNHLRARQALNFAINRNTVANLYGGLAVATPTCQIIPATIPGHVPYCPYTLDPTPSGRWLAPDLARARRLIATSGTSGEAVTLLTQATAYPGDEAVGRYTVSLLLRLGYHARLRVVEPSQFGTAINDYRDPPQIVTNSWIADHPTASQWFTLQLSCQAWDPPTVLNNHAEFCAPTVDHRAAQASQLQLTDPVAANRLWARADRTVTNLAPWVPTVTAIETDLVSTRVGNYQYVPTIGGLIDQLWVR